MAHIVFITSGLRSVLNVNLALAQRLAASGHRVTYASSYDVEAAVTARGLAFVRLPERVLAQGFSYGLPEAGPEIPPGTTKLGRFARKFQSWWGRVANARQRQQVLADKLSLGTTCNSIANLRADLLLIDVEMHEYAIAAATLGTPLVLLNIFFSLWKHPGLPPLHSDLLPNMGPLRLEWAWLQMRWRKWRDRQKWRWSSGSCDRVSILRRYARTIGFPFDREVALDQWQIPFTYRHLPVLVLNAMELEFPHQPAPHHHYVGPTLALNPPVTEHPEFATLLATARDRTVIYCAFGTFAHAYSKTLIRHVIDATSNRPEWLLILSLGGHNDPEALGALPPNVRAYRWVPQPQVLARADCAIVHAGISTLNECMQTATPMLVYPVPNWVDQSGNAARILYHGLGLRGRRDTDDATAIARHIDELLCNTTIRDNLAAMQARLQHYAKEDRAVRTVESFLPGDLPDRPHPQAAERLTALPQPSHRSP